MWQSLQTFLAVLALVLSLSLYGFFLPLIRRSNKLKAITIQIPIVLLLLLGITGFFLLDIQVGFKIVVEFLVISVIIILERVRPKGTS